MGLRDRNSQELPKGSTPSFIPYSEPGGGASSSRSRISAVSPQHALPPASAPVRQQRLSAALDEAERDAWLSAADGEARRAHLRLLQEPGAGPPC